MNNERVEKKLFLSSLILFLALLLSLQIGLLAQAKKQLKQKTTDISRRPPVLLRLPDLVVYMKCPVKAYRGIPIKKILKVFVKNQGVKVANNFFVEVVLSKNATIPVQKATYSPNFSDDVLLKGGRAKISTLNPGKTISVNFNGSLRIPLDAPLGIRYLGAVVDPDKIITELKEGNNVAKCSLRILMLITGTRELHHGGITNELDIRGFGFGTSFANKIVYVGAQPTNQNHILAWSPTSISILSPITILNGGQYYLIKIKQGPLTVSNVYNHLSLRFIEYAEPSQGTAGTLVALRGIKFSATQGTKVLKIGNTIVNTIVSWSNSEIKFNVPQNTPLGTHEIYIMDQGKLVSNKINFEVI